MISWKFNFTYLRIVKLSWKLKINEKLKSSVYIIEEFIIFSPSINVVKITRMALSFKVISL